MATRLLFRFFQSTLAFYAAGSYLRKKIGFVTGALYVLLDRGGVLFN
jgi:hypothetical protein